MNLRQVQINESWKLIIEKESKMSYFSQLASFLESESRLYSIFPKKDKIFSAFNLCSFKSTKIVIIGQDPYHNKEQAHGLSFSVPKGVKIPPSLRNIFTELHNDVNFNKPNHGDLTSWAEQGILLLNGILTVREKQPKSHQNQGWEQFTNNIIRTLSNKREGVIFLLWGKTAQKKAILIDKNKHHILKAPHPSPLSCYNGFFGCKHFSKTNSLLLAQNKNIIKWQI